MSRRKQARPKSLTLRADDEDEDSENNSNTKPDMREGGVLGGGHAQTGCSEEAVVGGVDTDVTVEEVEWSPGLEAYRCGACDVSFKKLSQFMDHRNYECLATDKGSAVNLSLSPTFSSDSPAPISSPEDSAVLLSSPRLLRHDEGLSPSNWVKNNSYPYQCDLCEISFQKVSHLRKHEQVHADQLPYSCEMCQWLFRHKRSRDRHMKSHMTLSRNTDLKLRVRSEATTPAESSLPFMCSYCDCSYDNTADLESHTLIHANGTDIESKPRNLDVMETVSVGSSLADDKQLSLPGEESPCEYCEKIFMSRAAMEFHMGQMHPDKCPFQCPVCLIQLSDAVELYEHVRWHSQLSYSESHSSPGKAKNSKKTMENGKRGLSRMLSPDGSGGGVAGKGLLLKRVKLECEMCGKTGFETEEILQDHMTEEHSVTQSSNGWDNIQNRRDKRSSSRSETTNNLIPWLDRMCTVCHQRFDSAGEALEHAQREHPAEYMRMVDSRPSQNNNSHNEDSRVAGVAGISSESFPCELCPVNFTDSESLQMHLENVHKNMGISCRNKTVDVPPVLCIHCSLSFPTILGLAQHMQTAHNFLVAGGNCPASPFAKLSRIPSPNPGFRQRNGPSNGELIVKCERRSPKDEHLENDGLGNGGRHEMQGKADIMYRSLYTHTTAALDGHINKEDSNNVGENSGTVGFTCVQCDMTMGTEEEFENHVTSHYLALETEYGCTSCMKLFNKPDELQKHLIDIHAHHMYRCSLCKEIFDSKVNIQVHFAIKHSNECKLYTCTQCATTFRSEMEWQLHVKVQHLCITKAYRCLFCKDSFTNDDQLQTHLSTHKKQFACQVCKESFHVEYLLDKHMQEKHSTSTGEVMTSDPVTPSREATPPHAVDLSTSPRVTPSKTSSTLRAVLQGNCVSERATPSNGQIDHITSSPLTAKLATYKCEICGLTFSSEEGVVTHKSKTHKVTGHLDDKTVQKNLLSSCLSPKVSQLLGSDKFGHVCVYCTQNFKTKAELEKHMKSHMSPTKQKCNICDQVFPSPTTLAEHKLSHCKVVRGDVCVVCKLVMKNEDHFYLHSQEHGVQGTSMTCIVCRQTLTSILELQLHGKAHFQLNATHYSCCVCLKTFPGKDRLTTLVNAGGKTYFVCKLCYRGVSPNPNPSPTRYPCLACSATFDSQGALEAHFIVHKKSFQCIKCQESFKTEFEIQAHVASHMVQEGNAHDCRICNRAFDSPAKLQCHLIDHTFEGSEVKCYVCEATFNNAVEIQLHVLSHDLGARRYCCSQCNQTFFFSAEMQNHLYVVHGVKASDSSYQCPDCTKIFTNVINLNNHRKLHATLKDATLKCTKCPLTFRSFTEVQQHFVSVHSPQELPVKVEKSESYNCTVCGEMFSTQTCLSTHLKLHSTGAKYSCSKCSKSFQSYQNFETHMKSHESGGPFVCTVCQKAFSRKESMRSHMKCHTGIKPYRCDKCTLTFSHRGQLKDHMTTHVNQTGCETCGKSFDTPKDLWRHQVIMHNMKTGHTCHICNSTYSDATDLEFHMKRVHSLEKISWSVKDKAGHRCVVCNSPYKNLKDLEFHVQQIHGFNTAGGAYQPADVMETGVHINEFHQEKNGVHGPPDDSRDQNSCTETTPVSKDTGLNGNNNNTTTRPVVDHSTEIKTDISLDLRKCRPATEDSIILLKMDSSGESVCVVNGETETADQD